MTTCITVDTHRRRFGKQFFSMSLSVFVLLFVAASSTAQYIDNQQNNIIDDDIREDDVVCGGFNQGLSSSGSPSQWYDMLRRRYTNCTYVDGSLTITWITDPNIIYDFDFLKTIRYVKGYVIIVGVNYGGYLPLINLETIRGNYTFNFRRKEYSLSVMLTDLGGVDMPRLKEISNGNVIVNITNPDLDINISRSWDEIMRGRPSQSRTSLFIQEDVWANTRVPAPEDRCSPMCPRRCFEPGMLGCCDSQCAVGCRGPFPTQCQACKDFNEGGMCVSHCSADHYPLGTQCIPK